MITRLYISHGHKRYCPSMIIIWYISHIHGWSCPSTMMRLFIHLVHGMECPVTFPEKKQYPPLPFLGTYRTAPYSPLSFRVRTELTSTYPYPIGYVRNGLNDFPFTSSNTLDTLLLKPPCSYVLHGDDAGDNHYSSQYLIPLKTCRTQNHYYFRTYRDYY